jgi:hypothetical protein
MMDYDRGLTNIVLPTTGFTHSLRANPPGPCLFCGRLQTIGLDLEIPLQCIQSCS